MAQLSTLAQGLIMPQTGNLHPLGKPQQYVIWWKRDKGNEMHELTWLGLFSSPDEAATKLEARYIHDLSPAGTKFRKKFAGGRFYPVLISECYPETGPILFTG